MVISESNVMTVKFLLTITIFTAIAQSSANFKPAWPMQIFTETVSGLRPKNFLLQKNVLNLKKIKNH